MIVMYQRISTEGQNLARQEVYVDKYKVEKVFVDVCSGKNSQRPRLMEMLKFVREGDVVLVESISRLARNVKDLLTIIETLKEKSVGFVSIKENIDTNTPTGMFMLSVFGALAQLERETILERQAEGIAVAKANGVYKGRAPMQYDQKKFGEMFNEWKEGKRTATSIQKEFNITGTTFYRWVKAQANIWASYYNSTVQVPYKDEKLVVVNNHCGNVAIYFFNDDKLPSEYTYKKVKFDKFLDLMLAENVKYFAYGYSDVENWAWIIDAYTSFTKKSLDKFLEEYKNTDLTKQYDFLFKNGGKK